MYASTMTPILLAVDAETIGAALFVLVVVGAVIRGLMNDRSGALDDEDRSARTGMHHPGGGS